MRKIIPLNKEWYYKDNFQEKDILLKDNMEEFSQVEIPHTNKMTPYNYFDETMNQFISCYARKLTIPKEYAGKKIFMDFEGVMLAADVFCNGKAVGEHKGGYTPFSIDLTEAVSFEQENFITVKVDSTERGDIPPFGNVVDYLTYGGIYREVSLRIAEPAFIEAIFVKGSDCLTENKKLEAKIHISSQEDCEQMISLELYDGAEKIARQTETVSCRAGKTVQTIELKDLKDIQLWDIYNPKLYCVKAVLEKKETEEPVDEFYTTFGFREISFCTEGFYLNGKKIKLIGLNRHQSYPYVGYAMPKRIQEKDAEILKLEAGVNIVRTSHYPQSKYFLDRCDQLGLLVLEEIPGWQHVGDEQWQEQSVENVREMIVRDYNHPSIILWGVRINESQDYHDFYTRTNAMARELDDSRQTGGIRYIQGSELLEDVYTYNDFSHAGGELIFRPQRETTMLDRDVPTLVTESNGHMYPTKRIDHESRRVEHALRHMRVISEGISREDLLGSISWCAFDYNTHSSFGSGDKICYHGVYDMFRIPKYAAYSYASQKNPDQGIVLETISLGCRGEKDGGGIIPFYVFTNCDYIKLYKNGNFVDCFYPEKELYPNLSYPPIIVSHLLTEDAKLPLAEEDKEELKQYISKKVKSGTLIQMEQADLEYLGQLAKRGGVDIRELMSIVIKLAGGWGDTENTLELIGYYQEKEAARTTFGECTSSAGLQVIPDDTTLYAGQDTYDATRIVVEAVNTYGNIMPFTQECVSIQIEGPLHILGPDTFALSGGSAAFWVKTCGRKGTAGITVRGMNHIAKTTIEIE